jgi:uncharacterized protein (TIGR02217 family)
MAFHDVRLPDEIEQGATGGPTFLTTVNPMSSGREQLNINWSDARIAWDISYGIQSQEDFDVCKAFFYARRGQGNSFRFKDWSDYQMVAEHIGVGDAVATQFQLTKTYEPGAYQYVRRITRPVVGTIHVFVGGVEVGFTLQPLGVVLLGAAPAIGALVQANAEFDVPVRFNVDAFSLSLDTSTAGAIGHLPLLEARE